MIQAERIAEAFVDVADTLVDEFDLIEFLQTVTSHAAELTRTVVATGGVEGTSSRISSLTNPVVTGTIIVRSSRPSDAPSTRHSCPPLTSHATRTAAAR